MHDDYYSERENLRKFCSDRATFEAADRALFFTKVKAKLKELKLKVDSLTYYTQANSDYSCYDLEGAIPWQRKTKKYRQNLSVFDTWLENVLYAYSLGSSYISRDCDTMLIKWEIDLVNYTLSYTQIEFQMSDTNTETIVGYTIESPVSFKQTPNLILNNLWQTKAFMPLFKYQDPQKAWQQIKIQLMQSLGKFKAVPIWYELQDEVDSLPKWELSLQLPLRNIGQWLADRYGGLQNSEDPTITFVFKN
jgi:hypothetical protein